MALPGAKAEGDETREVSRLASFEGTREGYASTAREPDLAAHFRSEHRSGMTR